MIDLTDPEHEIALDRPTGARCAVEAGLYDDLSTDSEPIAAIVEGVSPHCEIEPFGMRPPLTPRSARIGEDS